MTPASYPSLHGGGEVLGEEKMQGTMGGEMVEAGGNLASRERAEESLRGGIGARSAGAEERVARGGKGGAASVEADRVVADDGCGNAPRRRPAGDFKAPPGDDRDSAVTR